MAALALVLAVLLQAAEGPQVRIVPRVRGPAASPEETRAARLRVDASLVLIPVHVTTTSGAPLLNLTRDRFRIFEDGVEQRIGYFAQDDAPVSVGFVFDASGSMSDKIRQSAAAAAQFFKTANREDEFFLVEFNDRARLAVPLTRDIAQVAGEISRARTRGRTALFDGVHVGLEHMKHARNERRALVILSDGEDNRSRRTFSQVKNETFESGVQIYAIGIFDPEGQRKRTPEDAKGPQLLEEITRESGGRHYRADRASDLPGIAERIGLELRNEYLLGYYPTNAARDGKYRKLTVEVDAPDGAGPRLRTGYRRGYYAPTH
jgi:VWFA-related protein